jgi:hypothetical protein
MNISALDMSLNFIGKPWCLIQSSPNGVQHNTGPLPIPCTFHKSCDLILDVEAGRAACKGTMHGSLRETSQPLSSKRELPYFCV